MRLCGQYEINQAVQLKGRKTTRHSGCWNIFRVNERVKVGQAGGLRLGRAVVRLGSSPCPGPGMDGGGGGGRSNPMIQWDRILHHFTLFPDTTEDISSLLFTSTYADGKTHAR